MNFSFDESGGINSEALGEQNSNLLWFSHFEISSSILIFYYNLFVPKLFRVRFNAKIKDI